MPDITAGRSQNRGYDNAIQALSNISQNMNQGVANQLAIIDKYKTRKYEAKENQKSRNLQHQMNTENNKAAKLRQDSINKTSKRNTDENIKKEKFLTRMEHNKFLTAYQQASGLTDFEMYKTKVVNGQRQLVLNSYGMPILNDKYVSKYNEFYEKNKNNPQILNNQNNQNNPQNQITQITPQSQDLNNPQNQNEQKLYTDSGSAITQSPSIS